VQADDEWHHEDDTGFFDAWTFKPTLFTRETPAEGSERRAPEGWAPEVGPLDAGCRTQTSEGAVQDHEVPARDAGQSARDAEEECANAHAATRNTQVRCTLLEVHSSIGSYEWPSQ